MSAPDMARVFDAADETDTEWNGSYNVAPTQSAPIIVRDTAADGEEDRETSRILRMAHFGLIPSWSKDSSMATRMINARIETVSTSRAYRKPFSVRRAVVPVSGWYEWQAVPGAKKQPYFFTFGPDTPIALAGLWERWKPKGSDAGVTWSFTIVTCPAGSSRMADIHPRMSYVLPTGRIAEWLGEGSASTDDLLRGPAADDVASLEVYPVSRSVGAVRNNGPELVERVAVDVGSDTDVAGRKVAEKSDSDTLPGL